MKVEIKLMKDVVFKFVFRSIVFRRSKTAKILGRNVLNQDEDKSNC